MTHKPAALLLGVLVLLTAQPLLAAPVAGEKAGHARRQPDMSPGVGTMEHTVTGDTQAAWWTFLPCIPRDPGVYEGPTPDAIVPEIPYHEPTK